VRFTVCESEEMLRIKEGGEMRCPLASITIEKKSFRVFTVLLSHHSSAHGMYKVADFKQHAYAIPSHSSPGARAG
jgi:hypothetical protein